MARDKAAAKDIQTKAGNVGVFISWSGETSRAIAEAISSLIPNIFQDVSAFVSSNDIDAGSNWFGRISEELASTEFGILCLTQDNLAKPWIHFEAGALAKRITDRTRVVPYLHGVTLSDLVPPLSLFHGVKADQMGTVSLLKSLNGVRPEPFEQSRLHTIYDKWGSEFEHKLANLPPTPSATPSRSERDLLEEVLARLRGSQDSGVISAIGETQALIRQKAGEARFNKDNLLVQLTLKTADFKTTILQDPDFSKQYQYREVLSLLEAERQRLQYSPPY